MRDTTVRRMSSGSIGNLTCAQPEVWLGFEGFASRESEYLQLGRQVAQEPGVRLDAVQVQPVRRVDHEDALQEVADLL